MCSGTKIAGLNQICLHHPRACPILNRLVIYEPIPNVSIKPKTGHRNSFWMTQLIIKITYVTSLIKKGKKLRRKIFLVKPTSRIFLAAPNSPML